ncbi:MAG TPA: Kiwa anti-phage protein KwaB-like domain-containing protein, partial [Chloroflexota bacterium]|nr:Kiwa anti-phage protein KwaB-like domain-containing protein [Chloroflexota bacterium]
ENYSGGVLVGYLDPSNIPAIAQMRPHLENPLANPVLNPRQLGKKKVRLYVVSVKENASSWIHLLNETNARFRLEQHGILAAIFSDGVYSALEEEALLFTRDFDAVFDAKIILVIEQKPLQRALGILAAVQKQSKAILKAVTKSLAIQNYADFEAAVSSQLNMVPRLASIRERFKSDATYAAAMTMDNIVAFVRSNPQVDISIVSASGKPQIVFEPQPQKRWKILQLLDDDYLVSELTKQRYEVSSKSSLS